MGLHVVLCHMDCCFVLGCGVAGNCHILFYCATWGYTAWGGELWFLESCHMCRGWNAVVPSAVVCMQYRRVQQQVSRQKHQVLPKSGTSE